MHVTRRVDSTEQVIFLFNLCWGSGRKKGWLILVDMYK
jgi:hypothetical protein